MSLTCPTCGTTNEATYKFCRKCGTSLATTPPSGEETAPAPRAPDVTPPDAASATPPPAEAGPPPEPPAAVVEEREPAPPPVAPAPPVPAPPVPAPPVPAPPVATPPVATPPVASPPVASPPPAPGRPLKPRVAMPVMIGGLVALLGLGAAVGIVLGRGTDAPGPSASPGGTATPRPATPKPSTPTTPTPKPSTPAPTPAPSLATPAPTPAPSTATPGPGGTKVAGAKYVSVTVPSDWEVKAEDYAVTVFPTVGGSLYLNSGALTAADAPKTAAEWIKQAIAWRQEQFPDVKICGAEQDFQVFNGPPGRAVTLCYTATTQSGASYPATVFLFGAIVISGNDTLLFYQKIYARSDIWDDVIAALNPVLPSTTWALHTAS